MGCEARVHVQAMEGVSVVASGRHMVSGRLKHGA